MLSQKWFGILILGLLTGSLVLGNGPVEKAASLKGTVTDSRGNPLPQATVVLVNLNTQVRHTVLTAKTGEFVFKGLPSGNYRLKAWAAGFKPVVRESIRITQGKTVALELRLQPGPARLVEEELADLKVEMPAKEGIMGGVVGGVLGGVSQASYRTRPGETTTPYYRPYHNTEEYSRIYENIFLPALSNPLSTFSIDVDTASYANVRRFLNSNQLPTKDAVRIEEMINYFTYAYPEPGRKQPFALYTEISSCPWDTRHRLIHIGLQGRKLETEELPASNLVFLLDVSGSMSSPNKLPLLRQAFKLLVNELSPRDRVAIAVYAGAAGLVLPSTATSQKDRIIGAIEHLNAGGSTAGGAGIQLAYKVAEENLIPGGNNRIILATDGDFNVGVSSTSELVRMIEEKREKGVFLTVLGFGMGNYKDGRMEELADKGNGNYHYIDNLMEAKKVFVDDMRGTLFTIAKDVKLQVEFNPAKVKAYRLIGYENRMLKKEDFADDRKDAGELGAGHTVTALYEIIPYSSEEEIPSQKGLKYQQTHIDPKAFKSKEILTVNLRYKAPDANKSRLIRHPLVDRAVSLNRASADFKFSAAVASFGMLLRESEFKGDASYERVLELARAGKGQDYHGYRAEFIQLVEKTRLLQSIASKTD
ncbi:MAG: von Willebrand factor type A domain-containing protein [Candidatus Aminicenantaceae bacterium]